MMRRKYITPTVSMVTMASAAMMQTSTIGITDNTYADPDETVYSKQNTLEWINDEDE